MKMEIVHQGFDGLEVAFQGQIPLELDEELCEAKAHSVKYRYETRVTYNNVHLHVAESGSRGGYAYRCDTGPLGATWFFKRPNANDPWGIRVSVKSLPLAKYGIAWARNYIHDFLTKLGIYLSPLRMSIGRVDYAIDILAPEFHLNEKCIVAHARSKLKTHCDFNHVSTIGHSGRTTSVTIGSNPNRQVIIYDKREEVLTKSDKDVWWEIWDANRLKNGQTKLIRTDPILSRVWRVEFRAYKRHLKDFWHIKTWEDFDKDGGHVFSELAKDIRYTLKTTDENRSRWPNSAFWILVNEQLREGLIEFQSEVPENRLIEITADQQKQILLSQFLGLGVSMAGLENIDHTEFGTFLDKILVEAKAKSRRHKMPIDERIKKSQSKYFFILKREKG